MTLRCSWPSNKTEKMTIPSIPNLFICLWTMWPWTAKGRVTVVILNIFEELFLSSSNLSLRPTSLRALSLGPWGYFFWNGKSGTEPHHTGSWSYNRNSGFTGSLKTRVFLLVTVAENLADNPALVPERARCLTLRKRLPWVSLKIWQWLLLMQFCTYGDFCFTTALDLPMMTSSLSGVLLVIGSSSCVSSTSSLKPSLEKLLTRLRLSLSKLGDKDSSDMTLPSSCSLDSVLVLMLTLSLSLQYAIIYQKGGGNVSGNSYWQLVYKTERTY